MTMGWTHNDNGTIWTLNDRKEKGKERKKGRQQPTSKHPKTETIIINPAHKINKRIYLDNSNEEIMGVEIHVH